MCQCGLNKHTAQKASVDAQSWHDHSTPVIEGCSFLKEGKDFPCSLFLCTLMWLGALTARWVEPFPGCFFLSPVPRLFFSLFWSKISPCFSSEQCCRAVVGTGGKGQLGYQCPRSSSWSALHPFSHHSQSRQDPSDPALLLQELSACWSPPELAQQVLLISGQAGASQHENPPNNPSWSAVHPFSLTWDVFTGTICFPSPRVFRPVDYSNGRKCFVSCVISCRFNFYQICQFCHIIGLGFFLV